MRGSQLYDMMGTKGMISGLNTQRLSGTVALGQALGLRP